MARGWNNLRGANHSEVDLLTEPLRVCRYKFPKSPGSSTGVTYDMASDNPMQGSIHSLVVSLQLRVLRFGGNQDRDVGVGVLP